MKSDNIVTFIIQSCVMKHNLLFQKSKIFLDLVMIIFSQSNLGIFLKFYEIEPRSKGRPGLTCFVQTDPGIYLTFNCSSRDCAEQPLKAVGKTEF